MAPILPSKLNATIQGSIRAASPSEILIRQTNQARIQPPRQRKPEYGSSLEDYSSSKLRSIQAVFS